MPEEPKETYPKWIHDGTYWYRRLSESVNAHGWLDINGHRYWFDDKGRMATEWREIDGKWYYFQPESGKAASLAGALYVSDETGAQRILEVK
jgi:glucan-binding YG repeat protein